MDRTRIEWADATWNPVEGCTAVSEGCRNCYAARIAYRFGAPGSTYEGLAVSRFGRPVWRSGRVAFHPERLAAPTRWRRPRRIFAVSMGDLFAKAVRVSWIARVFGAMAAAPHHRFVVLTKRPRRMREVLSDEAFPAKVLAAAAKLGADVPAELGGSLGHVALGTSCEDQEHVDARVPELLGTPTSIRVVSLEPLLGTVTSLPDGIDWVIIGDESGPGARKRELALCEMAIEAARKAGASIFVKQWSGAKVPVVGGRAYAEVPDALVPSSTSPRRRPRTGTRRRPAR